MSGVPRLTDIEVYIKNRTVENITACLSSLCQSFVLQRVEKNGGFFYLSVIGEQEIPVVIQDRVSGKAWVSVWFNSKLTPWANDLECARQMSSLLDAQVRCAVSGWQDGDDDDSWWKVENDLVEKITWVT